MQEKKRMNKEAKHYTCYVAVKSTKANKQPRPMLTGLYTDEAKAREGLVPVTGACIASLFKSTRKGATDELAEFFLQKRSWRVLKKRSS